MGAPYNPGVVTELIAAEIERRTQAEGPGAQTRLAEALQVRVQTVNKWVKGQTTPEPRRLPEIEAALEMEPGTLTSAAGLAGPTPPGSVLARLEAAEAEVAELRGELSRIVHLVEQLEHRLGAKTPGTPGRPR